jgi:tripartite-type tricarboxylate transporter receptor subunit TctC
MMSFSRRRFLGTTLASAGLAAAPSLASAQAYPAQPLRWIIYQSPGGLIDTSTRLTQPFLKDQGFSSTLEYLRGASGRIARSQFSRAKPDGYTIMTEAMPEEVLGKVVFNADYKLEEFQPVFGWFINAFNLYVQKSSPIKTMDDFVKTARSRRMTVATIGKGGPSHLQLAILKNRLKLDLQFVHFDGGSAAYTAAAGGHVEAAIGGSSSVQWADNLTFLTVFRDTRDPGFPDVPTAKDLGLDIYPINEVIYVNASPGTPQDRLTRLVTAFTKAFENPELIAQQRKINVHVTPMNSAQLRQRVQKAFDLANEFKPILTEG